MSKRQTIARHPEKLRNHAIQLVADGKSFAAASRATGISPTALRDMYHVWRKAQVAPVERALNSFIRRSA